ncbi:class I SAM-dependent methyltransferase [Streptomyces mangrovisoli]|uniref:Methyltransferase type 11 n=1 Tax=Streptomyces mangrovisoli TaxID=1428628 RepID=A0A1J4NN68_9ACTN|nr:class I SAM-dependent methyltransferase [Streptomyces mangrovisoli]OIJ63799.1 methyltransferase type 11 [Streptomyces mangrovisoli]
MTTLTQEFEASERAMWDGRAAAYGASFGRLCAYSAEALLDAAGVGPDQDLLDAGTGTGTVAVAAGERGARVRAVDADGSMVAAARDRGIDARVAVLPELPFPDGAFDAVVANFVVNHVGRPRAALAELRRVLRPGGRIAVTVWGKRRGAGQDLLVRACREAGAEPAVPGRRLDPAEDFPRTPDGLARLLTDAGFGAVAGRELEWDHRAGAEEWWSGAAAGIGQVGHLVAAQPPATRERIRRAYDGLCAEFADGAGGLLLPHVAVLAHGTAQDRPWGSGEPS